jgi:epsilon-lactone hydrolase
MAASEIGVIRTLLSSKPRPQGWAERRARIDEVGSVWPVAADVELASVDFGGIPGEWSIVPGSEKGCVLLFFHGGGYCSGSLRSHRRLVERGRQGGRHPHARHRVSPGPGASVSRRA